MARWWDPGWKLRVGAIAWLIVAIVRPPLPVPDYHQIEHHDGPGQVCEYHEHLLRWHVEARHAPSPTVLHWHWVVFQPLRGGVADSDSPLPVCHGQNVDWLAPTWTESPQITSSRSTLPLARFAAPGHDGPSPSSGLLPHRIDPSPPQRAPAAFARALRATSSPPSLASLQRWTC